MYYWGGLGIRTEIWKGFCYSGNRNTKKEKKKKKERETKIITHYKFRF